VCVLNTKLVLHESPSLNASWSAFTGELGSARSFERMNNKRAKRFNRNNFRLRIALLGLLLAAACNVAAQSKPAAKEPFGPD
jgi:hypothetical protein